MIALYIHTFVLYNISSKYYFFIVMEMLSYFDADNTLIQLILIIGTDNIVLCCIALYFGTDCIVYIAADVAVLLYKWY